MRKEVNCINSSVVINYVKAYNNGDVSGLLDGLDPELDLLPDKEKFLTDRNNWISSAASTKLLERARLIFNDPMTGFNIGRYAAENMSLGYRQRIIVKAFGSVNKGLRNLQKIYDKWSRTKRVELVRLEKNSAVIRLYWYWGISYSRDICLYNQGVYVYMPLVWGCEPLTLKEECCYFNGAPYCEYTLWWSERKRIRDIFSGFLSTRAVLSETIAEMERDKELLERKYEEVNHLNIRLKEKVEQLQAIQDTGKAIVSVLNLEKLLSEIMNSLSSICSIERAVIMTVNEENTHLEFLYGTDFDENAPDEVLNYREPLGNLDNFLVRVTGTGKTEYISDVGNSNLNWNNVMLSYCNPKSVFAVPLITRSMAIGVIAVDTANGKGIPEKTRKTLELFAPQIAIAIENAGMYERLKKQMLQLKQSHALLSRSEKFAFLGDLAARLAHEIKNSMTAVGTFIQMLPLKYNDEEYRGNFHRIAMEETLRINNLISELLDLVNTKASRFELNNLHKNIEKMLLLISLRSNEKKIEIIRKYDHDIIEIWFDSDKMKQVILNLLTNALEFTPDHGKLEIVTQKIVLNGLEQGFRIEIADNGEGIHEDNISRIFDPYFTTKNKSMGAKGTGLGLFIAYQNIADHGGSIEVTSERNKGSRFTITLPANPSEKN